MAEIEEMLGENEYIANDAKAAGGKKKRHATYYLVRAEFSDLTLKKEGGLDDGQWFPLATVGDLIVWLRARSPGHAEALAEGVDQILLDNMTPPQLKEAVARVAGRAVTEASGSITKATAPAIAESGVDLISVGWITHSAPCLDLGLDLAA